VTAAHEDRILDALKAAPKDGLLSWQRRRDCGVNLCMARSHELSTMAEFAANGPTIHARDAAYII
jgi:hypothetical protein